MNIAPLGMPLIWVALVATTLSFGMYVLAAISSSPGVGSHKDDINKWAAVCYAVSLASVLTGCAVHATLLLTHDFNVAYVYEYSSRFLPWGYLFATFWAGQDGSFLLWAFWIAVLGQVVSLTLANTVRARFMSVYSPVLLFLLVILAVRNPFLPYSPNPGMPMHPMDGIGLNPLLENPWMVIHPPTLFLGFAALTVPFAFAFSALLWGDDNEWYRRTWPWVLFAFSTLGLGVMLGGYWAYETLGWGGFWGWDPVEDGPLVPWLTTVALVHAIQVNHERGGLRKSTLFLAMFGFVTALYETFLTRTGILDKFSNHSFSTLGGTANGLVLYGLLGATVASLIVLAWRSKTIKNDSGVWDSATSREFGLTLSVIILLACAIIVGVGMSAPLITSAAVALRLLPSQSSVSPDFFNRANFPEAILLGLGMATVPFLSWQKSGKGALRPMLISLLVAVIVTVTFAAFAYGYDRSATRPVMLLLFFSSTLAASTNVRILFSARPKKIPRKSGTGGAVAHIGVAMILIGIIGLVMFTRKESPTLVLGRPVKLATMPYRITYTGMTSNVFNKDNQLRFAVTGLDGKKHFVTLMDFAVRNVEGKKQILARPAIVMQWWGDLYFAFEDGPETFSPNQMQSFTLTRGKSQTVDGYKVMLTGFSIPAEIDAEVASGVIPDTYPVTAHLSITAPDGTISNVATVNTRYKDDPIPPAMPETIVPGHDTAGIAEAVAFQGIDPNTNAATFYLRQASVPLFMSYTIEVSTRPAIGLVWLGTLLIVSGGLISLAKRASSC